MKSSENIGLIKYSPIKSIRLDINTWEIGVSTLKESKNM